ncbi:MAG: hemerythrin domain-containing protein [Candidatus Melainabacteria bacterium]
MSLPVADSCLQVCTSLTAEHLEMETLLQQFETSLNAGDPTAGSGWDTLAPLLHTIRNHMNVHFVCEEEALFPAVTPYHPMVLMEVEHEELMALREEMMSHFHARQATEFVRTGRVFIEDLRNHIAREDAGIFPACERALSDTEKQQVVEAMDRIRANAVEVAGRGIRRPEKTWRSFTMDLTAGMDKPIHVLTMAEAPGLQIKHLRLRGGESLAAHWTPQRLVVVCVAGEVVFQVITPQAGDEETVLRPGAGVLLDPQLRHALRAREDSHLLLLQASDKA